MARFFAGGTTTDNIHIANQAAITGTIPLSISFWFTIALDATLRRAISKSSNANSNDPYEIFASSVISPSTNVFQFNAPSWNVTAGSWQCPCPTDGAWHHFLLTYAYSSISDNPLIYIDGVSQTVSVFVAPAGTLGTDTAELYIGNCNFPSHVFNRTWAGNLAEVAIWQAILTSGNASSLAAGTIDPRYIPGLVGYWPLCGNSPESDLSGNNNIGVVTGTVIVGDPAGIISPCNRLYSDDNSMASIVRPSGRVTQMFS